MRQGQGVYVYTKAPSALTEGTPGLGLLELLGAVWANRTAQARHTQGCNTGTHLPLPLCQLD